MSSRIDYINFMKSYSMNNLLSFMKFTFRTLNIPLPSSNCIKISMSCKWSSKLWNFSTCFINSYNVSGLNFFFRNSLNHFLSQIIHSFHFSCLKCDFPSLCSWCSWFINFNFKHFSLNYLRLFSNSHTNRFSEGLAKGLSFWHFERKDFWTR